MAYQPTLEISNQVYQLLLQEAQTTGRTVEGVVEACLAGSVRCLTPESRLRRWAGALASIVPDTGLRHDEFLGQTDDGKLDEPHRD
jgi:hypothetical protein